jgi:hypothetical protein
MTWRDRPGPGGPWFSVTYDLRGGAVARPTYAGAGATLARPDLRSKHLRVIATAGRNAWRSPALPIVGDRSQDTYVLSLPLTARVLAEPATVAVAWVGERGEILLRRSFETAPPAREALFRQALAAATAKARDPSPCVTMVEGPPAP